MTLGRGLHYLALSIDALVGNDSAPVKRFDDIFFRTRNEACRVGVLDSYDEVSSVLLGIEIVIKCSAHAAHMKRSGRGWRKSYSCLSHFCILLIAGIVSKSRNSFSSSESIAGFCSGLNLIFDLFSVVLKPMCELQMVSSASSSIEA